MLAMVRVSTTLLMVLLSLSRRGAAPSTCTEIRQAADFEYDVNTRDLVYLHKNGGDSGFLKAGVLGRER